ncbi:hypothetical protein PM082_000075 [Marasmius tenuissimus]|nr:hypothetical protein PM082_000075 [Marasmius tenuissimus]
MSTPARTSLKRTRNASDSSSDVLTQPPPKQHRHHFESHHISRSVAPHGGEVAMVNDDENTNHQGSRDLASLCAQLVREQPTHDSGMTVRDRRHELLTALDKIDRLAIRTLQDLAAIKLELIEKRRELVSIAL